jgi:hypothetical protein
MVTFSSVFVSAINFATDLTDNEIPWKQIEVPLIGCWTKSNSPGLDLLSLILCMPVTVAQRSKACTVFARLETGILGSNPTQGMDV